MQRVSEALEEQKGLVHLGSSEQGGVQCEIGRGEKPRHKGRDLVGIVWMWDVSTRRTGSSGRFAQGCLTRFKGPRQDEQNS